jgi:hypothetical protein
MPSLLEISPSVIARLVRAIQPSRVGETKKPLDALDSASLDYPHEVGNDGVARHVPRG